MGRIVNLPQVVHMEPYEFMRVGAWVTAIQLCQPPGPIIARELYHGRVAGYDYGGVVLHVIAGGDRYLYPEPTMTFIPHGSGLVFVAMTMKIGEGAEHE